MCKAGDIILVDNYISNGINLSRHSFVIISDSAGTVQGLEYDVICNVISSFKNENQKAQKMRYPGNFPITYDATDIRNGKNGNRDGYIKAEQFYYFNLSDSNLSYRIIGSLAEDVYEFLIKFIEQLSIPIEHIIDNL